MTAQTRAMALGLGVVGLMNVQFAIQADEVFILEVNPRASRTVPFVAKAVNSPIAAIAARIMAGERLCDFDLKSPVPAHFAVKEAVLPFNRFPGVDPLLGPEMRSTGEVMGLDVSFERAFYKAQLGAGVVLPDGGTVFISIKEEDKSATMLEAAKILFDLGFDILATSGTSAWLDENSVGNTLVLKGYEGSPNIVDKLRAGEVDLILNTTTPNQKMIEDSKDIRAAALRGKIPYCTTAAAGNATARAILTMRSGEMTVSALQDYGV
ncbi:MAG: carbamoyl phosphate synthase large subunit, partial [Proteobacteria bacterium]|nr:carbamoyl phosphate synthase large subunit [Pseudomonadota bacterium]